MSNKISNFFRLLKDMSKEDIEDLRAVLYSEPQILICNSELSVKISKNEQDTLRSNWHALSLSKPKQYKKIIKMLEKDFKVYKELDPNEFINHTFPEIPLLIQAVEEQLELIATGQEIPKDKRITLIECFTSRISDNDYSIVINGDYLRPLEVSKTTKTWKRFFDLLEDGWLDMNEENRDLYDYLNSNDKNLIFKNTEYPRQTLIKIKNNSFVPNFKYHVGTNKMLVQRKTKQEKST